MNPLYVVLSPLPLALVGILLNSFRIGRDQPEFSIDHEPICQLTSERRATYDYVQLQSMRNQRRQQSHDDSDQRPGRQNAAPAGVAKKELR